MVLQRYFTREHVGDALTAYSRFAVTMDWGPHTRLRLYNLAKVAFGEENPTDARAAFSRIYDHLRGYWKIFRNAQGEVWDADRTFDALLQYCLPFSRPCRTLKNLRTEDVPALLAALRPLKPLKPVRYYPHMAVSKVTHFFNPKLFPIYDNEVIWKMVCQGPFRSDYRAFFIGHGYDPSENRVHFNVGYTHWASAVIQGADPEVMSVFADWFRERCAGYPDPSHVLDDADTYYAAAFELITIGAMYCECAV